VNARVNWLKGELARADETALKAARGDDEARCIALAPALAPALTPAEAYKWFGAFLGLFPPAAIFWRAFLSSSGAEDKLLFPVLLCVGMNAVCCVVGRKVGAGVGRLLGDPRDHSRAGLVMKSMLLAVAWAVATGGAGGAVFFGFGAIFGAVFALPVALVAFPAFAVLHRLHARGGMIEGRSLWPLAFGVPGVAAALILSLK